MNCANPTTKLRKYFEILTVECGDPAKINKLTWADVDRALVTKFLDHLQKLDYMGSSVNKYLVSFRAMVGYAYEDGLHNNDRALSCFSKRKVEESDKAVEIYLTETELQALAEMELTGLKGQVRDIFLVGCYTCQRVSDYNNIQPEDFTTTAKQRGEDSDNES